MSKRGFNLPIYNGKNSFSAWKHKVLAYLEIVGLKDCVNRPGVSAVQVQILGDSSLSSGKASIDARSGSSSSVSSATTRQKNCEAYALLINLLDDSLVDLISVVP